MNKELLAKNLLEEKTCYNCDFYSNVYRMETTHKKQQCFFSMNFITPLPPKKTCEKWREKTKFRMED